MILKKITVQDQVYDIVTLGGSVSGNRKRIYITNLHATLDAKAYLWLEDSAGVKHHFLSGTVIPPETTLEYRILPFNESFYHLRFKTTSATPTVDIIFGN
tara:strand:- start:164 stop:463 length:300 start_codon:yes stop_codon:yes gene_type:complete